MQQQQLNIISHQMKSLVKQFEGKDGENFRKEYVVSQLQLSLAEQLKALRGNKTQEEFSAEIGKPQSVICRLENPDTPKSIKSLLEIAHRLKIAVLVRLVDFPTLLSVTGDYSEGAMAPLPYDQISIEGIQENNEQTAKSANERASELKPFGSARDSYSASLPHAPLGHNQAGFLDQHSVLSSQLPKREALQ